MCLQLVEKMERLIVTASITKDCNNPENLCDAEDDTEIQRQVIKGGL